MLSGPILNFIRDTYISPQLPEEESQIPVMRGITNHSGTDCAFNALAQMIMRSEPLLRSLSSSPNNLPLVLLHANYMGWGEDEPDSRTLRRMVLDTNALAEYAIPRDSGQVDASEVLSLLIGSLGEDREKRSFPCYTERKTYQLDPQIDLPRAPWSKPVPARREDCSILEESATCKAVPHDPQIFLCLQESPADVRPDFNAMLTQFLRERELNDDPAYFLAPQTGPDLYRHTCVGVDRIFDEKPEVLIVTLRRFRADGSKIETEVQVPRVLDLPLNSIKTPCADPRLVLKSFIVHSSDPGHYITYAKGPDNQWYCYDDRDVTQVSLEDVDYNLQISYVHCYEPGDADAEPPLQAVIGGYETESSRCNSYSPLMDEGKPFFTDMPRIPLPEAKKRRPQSLSPEDLRQIPPNLDLSLELPKPDSPEKAYISELKNILESWTKGNGDDWREE